MNQPQPMTRLEVVNVETLEVTKAVYMTTQDPLQIQKMSDSLLRHMNTFEFFVRATPSAAPVVAAVQDGRITPQWVSVDESLPDGKYCLATYQDRAGKLRVIRAMYVRQFEIEANGDECDSETNEENGREYLKAGWYELIDNWGEYSSVYVCEGPVKYWMPLPAAPVAPGA